MRKQDAGKKVSVWLGITFAVSILLLISVAATYETYSRGDHLRERLQAAVEAGKITQEQADDKLELMSNRKTNGWKHWDSDHLRERLQAAVEAGKITQEQADDKLELMSNRKTNGWKHRNRIHDHKHLP